MFCSCLADWRYFDQLETWTDALEICRNDGGDLVSILTPSQNEHLLAVIAEANPVSGAVWIGGNDFDEEVRAHSFIWNFPETFTLPIVFPQSFVMLRFPPHLMHKV